MSIKTNDILIELRTQLATISGYSIDQINIGPTDPAKLIGKPRIGIAEMKQPGNRIDAGKSERGLTVVVGVMCRLDVVKGDVDLQLNEVYEVVHAKLETLRDGLANYFLTLTEDPAGPESENIWDQFPMRVKSCAWTIAFERTLGATE